MNVLSFNKGTLLLFCFSWDEETKAACVSTLSTFYISIVCPMIQNKLQHKEKRRLNSKSI